MERVKTRAWICLIALCAIAPQIALAESDPIVFGVFPRWNAQITVRDFTPLAEQLGRELGQPVRIETDKDFDSFMRRVYAKEFDLVHLNQLQYVRAHQAAGYRAIAKLCDNPDCTIKAIIVTRRDAKLTRVSDLRGKTIAFGDPSAMVSHVLAKSLLLESAIGPDQYRTIFTKNPPNALLAVYNGEADAAGVGMSALQRPEIRQRIDVNQLRILAESRQIPHLPVAVRGDLDRKLARRIQHALTRLAQHSAGHAMLEQMGVQRFAVADDREYDIVRRLMEDESGAH
jgi:phosphonate transport system substrate-binding protein